MAEGGEPDHSRRLELDDEIERIREEYELEILPPEETTEGDLQKLHKVCKKNPGHPNFYPFNEFDMQHLPKEWRDPWVYKHVKSFGQKVVNVVVKFTSRNRPDTDPFAIFRGTSIGRTGTGTVQIDEEDLKKPSQLCPFPDCNEVEGPHYVTPKFMVVTAAHVVFDKEEAMETKVTFALESDESNNYSIITARGFRVEVSSTLLFEDTCLFTCVSHDVDLFKKVFSAAVPYEDDIPPVPPPRVRDPLVVVISHPHGCTKQVTFGEWTDFYSIPSTQSLTIGEMLHWYDNTDDPSGKFKGLRTMLQQFPKTTTLAELLDRDEVKRLDEFLKSDAFYQLAHRVTQNYFPNVCSAALFGDKLVNAKSPLWANVVHSADTCPGSSGAIILMFLDEDDGNISVLNFAVHSGVKKKRNVSSHIIIGAIQNKAFHRYIEKLREIPLD